MIDKPFTEKGDKSIQQWAQAEYAACIEKGIPFSAHGNTWYYNYRRNNLMPVHVDEYGNWERF